MFFFYKNISTHKVIVIAFLLKLNTNYQKSLTTFLSKTEYLNGNNLYIIMVLWWNKFERKICDCIYFSDIKNKSAVHFFYLTRRYVIRYGKETIKQFFLIINFTHKSEIDVSTYLQYLLLFFLFSTLKVCVRRITE